jgi:hypothetical protein
MHCREYQDLFSELHDGLPAGRKRDLLIAHLRECNECSAQWELFEESLSSLALLSEDGAPQGFTEGVFRRIAERKSGRSIGLRQLLFSPAGAIFCVMLFFAGAGLGFFAGRQHGSSLPLEEVKAMAARDGMFLLPGKTASGVEYALVPVDGRAPRVKAHRPTPVPVPRPYPRSREFLVGGNETMEVYLQPERMLASTGAPPEEGRSARSLENAYQTLVEESY